MSAFATEELMGERTRGLITATSHPFLAKELDAATREIQNYCGWHIAPEESKTITRLSRFPEEIWIPAMQITAVTAVQAEGIEWSDLTGVEFDPQTGWTNIRARRIHLTYTAGFEEVPEDLVALTLQMAARALGVSLGILREQTLSASLTFTASADDRSRFESVLMPYKIGYLP
ncbi:hypothetical protein [Microbacterium aurantiacum]|uniref:hypothetical protein n=1 Tax=Microbacterium aurantiacum TaxID=162393 RepID=UPI00343BAB50